MPEYHPLDVRYKGPSTAYRGRPSKRRMDDPLAETQKPVKTGPLAKGPPPLPVHGQPPPPLPQTRPRIQMPDSRPRTALRRVLTILAILIAVVFANQYIGIVTGMMSIDAGRLVTAPVTP